MKVGPIAGAVAPPSVEASRLTQASREFEAVFVRQILAQAKIAGKSDAYSGMAIDAVAAAVTEGRGLGIARLVEDAVSRRALADAVQDSSKGLEVPAVPPK